MAENVERTYENFLKPESLRQNLLLASLYLTAFEFTKGAIVDRLRAFFSSGINENSWMVDEEYESEVLALSRSPVYATLLWLEGMSAIDQGDIKRFTEAKNFRNELAHELPDVLSRGIGQEYTERFKDLIVLLNKIEKWWVVNVEASISPDLINQKLDEDQIIPGSVIFLQIMLQVALGSEGEAVLHYNEFKRLKEKKSQRL